MKGRSLLALSILSLALACEGAQQTTGPGAPVDGSKIIQDGAHGGNKDFFFLPPMVPLPLHNPDFQLGKFNNALRPSLRVEICELDGLHLHSTLGVPTDQTKCLTGVPLKKVFAPGTVQLVNLPLRQNGWWTLFGLPADGFYYVLWDTRQSTLDVTKFYRISVFVQGYPDALGVADVDPMSSLRQWKYSLTGDVIQLVDDVMLPITFRVEQGALCPAGTTCSSATYSNTTPLQVTVDPDNTGSVAGVLIPDNALPTPATTPSCTPANPCPTSVVVNITEVPSGVLGQGFAAASTICHHDIPKLQQFKGCYNFSTTPELRRLNENGDQFVKDVLVGVCYELEGTGDPREKFAQLYQSSPDDEEPSKWLDDVPEGTLIGGLTKDCTAPVVGSRSSNPLIQFASAGWRTLKGGLNSVFGIKTAYAIDLGLGGLTKGFSHISPVLRVEIQPASLADVTLAQGQDTTRVSAKIVTEHFHGEGAHPGVNTVPVTFSVTEGNGTIKSVTDAGPGVSGSLTVSTASLPAAVAINGIASVIWTLPHVPGTYTMTADGPAYGGPITYHATVSAAADLVVSSGVPGLTPSFTSYAGGSVHMDPWTITNQGGAFTLGGLVDNGFYLSTDPVITNTDELIGENHNGQEITTAGGFFNWGGPTFAIGPHTPGVYYLGVLVDQTNQVLETNENNNYAKHGLIVLGPDETDSPWGPTERRMLSMQTGATYSLFTSPLGSAWNFTNPDRIYVAGTPQLGHVLITALVGGENIATGADASITSLLGPPDPVTGVSPAGPSILVNSFSFDIYPRVTTLAWNAVVGAVAYHVVTEYGNGSTADPTCRFPSLCGIWTEQPTWTLSNRTGSTFTRGLTHTFDFPGGQAGRWRVYALDANGDVINTSAYVYFSYIG